MKTVLFMAMSANGIIADKDGSEEFLSDVNWETFTALTREYGNFIYGRKAFEAVESWGPEYSLTRLGDIEKVIISKDAAFTPPDGYIKADSPKDALTRLEAQHIETALVAGGSTITSAFAKEGLLNEIVLNIEPAVLGQGIPLFKSDDFTLKLELSGTQTLAEGIVQLRYKVLG